MDKPLYFLVRSLVWLLQALPLGWVARVGRAGGELAYWADRRHRRVARHLGCHRDGGDEDTPRRGRFHEAAL